MSSAPPIPGLYYTAVPPEHKASPLRTDVAGFFGRTARGPVGAATRVKGWREYNNLFGGLDDGATTTYAVRGYFDNGGDVAYVVRLLCKCSLFAKATWQVGTINASDNKLDGDWPGAGGFTAIQYCFEASSPGDWANNTSIKIRYWALGSTGEPELEMEINPPGEAAEVLTGIDPFDLVSTVNNSSAYVRAKASPLPATLSTAQLIPPAALSGPRYFEWAPITLSGGTSIPPTKEDYLAAITSLGDQIEVALVLSPDLYHPDFYSPDDSSSSADVVDIVSTMLRQADRLHDRLVIFDVPPDQGDPLSAVNWVDSKFRNPVAPAVPLTESVLRCGAVYHPRLIVPDPLGSAAAPLRCVPCSGLVAGVVSRMDLQEGAYITPANAEIQGAVDLSRPLSSNDQDILYSGGLNLLTCSPSQGLLVWGGRVLGMLAPGGFLAHRRLIHLLVRAIRRVAEPLVFDTNGPQLWLALVRSITTVLLNAYRAGALKGNSPDQAFRVQCDDTTNLAEDIENGICTCLVQVAPVAPMEFITLRVAVSAQGQLEVFES
jgi:hypothetical protein